MKDFEILVFEGTNPSGVSLTRDILAAAALFAERNGVVAPSWKMYSPDGGRIALQGGITVDTARLPPRRAPVASTLLIPGLWTTDVRQLRERLSHDDCRRAMRLVARHVRLGGQVAASCSAVFLLHAAGVLAGRQVTTAWWLAPELARIAPDTAVESNRVLCVDGPIVTAGAAFAQSDAVLHLLRRRFGTKLAEGVSRALLLLDRSEQAQFVVPSMLASGDALVSRLTERIEQALPEVPSVATLAQALCMSERTLGRHVRQATGMSTGRLVQSIRVQRARHLLQSSRMPVEDVAAAVGYRDATALRRLLRAVAGTTPSKFRSSASVAGRERSPAPTK